MGLNKSKLMKVIVFLFDMFFVWKICEKIRNYWNVKSALYPIYL